MVPHIRSMHHTSFKSAPNSRANVKGKFILPFQLVDLRLRVHFGVLDILDVPLLIGTMLIDRCFKNIFPMQRQIVPIWPHPVAIIAKYSFLSNQLAALQRYLDAETITDSQLDSCKGTFLIRITNCVAIPPNIEALVSVTTSSTGLIYLVLHPNSMQTRMFLLCSRIINVLPHVQTKLGVRIFSEKPSKLLKRMLIDVGADRLEAIVHMGQAATIPRRRRKKRMILSHTPSKCYNISRKSH